MFFSCFKSLVFAKKIQLDYK